MSTKYLPRVWQVQHKTPEGGCTTLHFVEPNVPLAAKDGTQFLSLEEHEYLLRIAKAEVEAKAWEELLKIVTVQAEALKYCAIYPEDPDNLDCAQTHIITRVTKAQQALADVEKIVGE